MSHRHASSAARDTTATKALSMKGSERILHSPNPSCFRRSVIRIRVPRSFWVLALL